MSLAVISFSAESVRTEARASMAAAAAVTAQAAAISGQS